MIKHAFHKGRGFEELEEPALRETGRQQKWSAFCETQQTISAGLTDVRFSGSREMTIHNELTKSAVD
jgi:hypothetical protein